VVVVYDGFRRESEGWVFWAIDCFAGAPFLECEIAGGEPGDYGGRGVLVLVSTIG
jgi:hypothetical protein